jgi:glycerophosphoryl diester phosphodiesterase
VLAHRGLVTASAAADGVAENSFLAVAAAHAEGLAYVESDCHLTADGVVVLWHDADLRRITGDARTVADCTMAELEQLMSSRGGAITLEQALDTFPTLRFNLDVKADAAAEPTGRLVARASDRVLLTSFSDERRLTALAAAYAHGGHPATSGGTGTVARAVAAVAVRSRTLLSRALRGIDALQVPERRSGVRIVTPRFVSACHDVGVEVHVWTVNQTPDMLRMLDLDGSGSGVDGLITDRADVALRLVHKIRDQRD